MTIIIIVIVIISILLLRLYLRANVAICTSQEMMTGKVVIVTGGNGGIGFEIARGLARRGARVILACRNAERGSRAAAAIARHSGNAEVLYKSLDLASLHSIRSFCRDIAATEARLDVLVNNAAGYSLGNLYTKDNIVEEMQVNFFGPFLLTLLLLPLLKQSRPSRIVMLSSIASYFGVFNPTKINRQKYYSNFRTYANSKLCDVMLCSELSRRLQNTGVVANAVHPGNIHTNITNESSFVNKALFKFLCWLTPRSVIEGAQTPIYLAVAKEVEHVSGKFFCDCKIWPMPIGARDEKKCVLLWKYSEELVGFKEEEVGTMYFSRN